jgi:lipopolysaccharide transport system permease protein
MKTKDFFNLTLFMTGANLKKEISQYYLNYLWWILEPILDMLIFYLVFGIMLNRGTPDFVAFLLVGSASWLWFSKCVNNSASSIYQEKAMLQQIYIPKVFFPLSNVLQNSVKQLAVIFLLLVFLCLQGAPVSVTWLALPILMVVQFFLICGCAFVCSAIVPFFPDLRFLISAGLHLMFFASGIFYSLESVVLPRHMFLAYLNPMAGLIKNYRLVLMSGQWPQWGYLLYVLCVSLFLCAFSIWLLKRFDHVYPRILCE